MNNSSKPTAAKPRDLDAFLATMRRRFRLAEEAISDLHRESRRDFQYRLGGEGQWDDKILAQRKLDGRPCYSLNRIPEFIHQVTSVQKKNRPAIECSPIGDGSDIETAEIIQGLCRHIERTSSADDAYDTAFDHAVTGGFGYFRLMADYASDDSSDQDIRFVREKNPFSHYPDPRCNQLDYSDAKYWFIVDDLPADDFKEEFPGSTLSGLADFSGVADQAPDWIKQDSIRIAEYYWIETSTKSVGAGKHKRDKEVKSVHWCKTNGIEILDECDIPGEYIPVVPVLAEEVILDGKRNLIGIVRNARKPQELYNLWQSAMAETIALAPKAPYLATPLQVEGYEELWDSANTSNLPYLPYNPDPKAPGMPQRQFAEPPIQAITTAIAHADNDLKTTTGLYDASLGAPGPEQSGKAILLRQKQGEGSTFGLVDGMTRAIKHAGRIILGWIPTYYDAARLVHIVEPDGTSSAVQINQPFQNDAGVMKCFDLTAGTYDIAVSSGPSYDSMREEAAQSMLQLVQAEPSLMSVIGDLLVKNFDWPMAAEISDRLKKLLPPALQEQGDPAQNAQIAQQKLEQSGQMIDAMTKTIHALSAQLESKQVEAASKERVALIQAKAMIEAAALKAKSAEALAVFQADVEQIDRQLGLIAAIPDPAQGVEANGPQMAQQPQAAANPTP